MKDDRIPKKLLFGWLPQRRPAHGTKLRWKDKVRKDLKKFNIEEGSWFHTAQERGPWRARCKEGLDDCTRERLEKDRARQMAATAVASAGQAGAVSPTANFVCNECHRSFRRRQDIARHNARRLATVVECSDDSQSANSVCHSGAEGHHPFGMAYFLSSKCVCVRVCVCVCVCAVVRKK